MNVRKPAAAFVVSLLIAPLVLWPSFVGAEEKVVREAVITQMLPDGTPANTNVAQLIHLEASGGKAVELKIPDIDDLESYRNLSGFRGASGEADNLVWKTDGEFDTRALASYNGELPIDVNVKYFLGDEEMSADQIRRQDGDVKIEVEVTNQSGNPKTLEYDAITSPYLTSVVDQYMPLEYVVRIEFPTDRWSNVGGEGVKVAMDADKEIASMSGILSPPLTEASTTLTFEAHSDDVLTPRVQVYAVPGLSQSFIDALDAQFDALRALYEGSGSIGDNLKAVYDGTIKLVDGTDQMSDGTGLLSDGLGQILGGVGRRDPATGRPVMELDADGNPTTVLSGIGLMLNGFDQLLPAVGDVDQKTGRGIITKDEKGRTKTLLGGLQTQEDALDDELIPGLKQLVDGVDQISGGLGALDDGMTQLSDGVSGGAAELVAGLNQLRSGLTTVINLLHSGNPGSPGIREGIQQISAGATQILAGLGNTADAPTDTTVIGGLELISGGVGQLVTGLGDKNLASTDTTVIGGLKQMSEGTTLALTNLTGTYRPTMLSLQSDINTALSQFQALSGADQAIVAGLLPNLATLLGGMQLKVAGLVAGLGDPAAAPSTSTIIGGTTLLNGGLLQMIGELQTDSSSTPGFREGLLAVEAGVADLLSAIQTNSTATPGIREGLQAISNGANAMIIGLGDKALPSNTSSIIGVLKLVRGGLGQASAGGGTLVTAVVGALAQMKDGVGQLQGGMSLVAGGLSNPEFNQEQNELDGQTPKEYYQECPGCWDPDHELFDPATANPQFQPKVLEALQLMQEGIVSSLPKLVSFDPDNPGLVDALKLIAGGLGDLAEGLHTFDPDGLAIVNGLEQAKDGTDQLDDGAKLIHGGMQQVNQGLFAINELGVRTLHGTVGDKGDEIARTKAAVTGGADDAKETSAIGADADVVTATYVFDLAAQSTAGNDNARRGALTAVALASTLLLARRMKRFDL